MGQAAAMTANMANISGNSAIPTPWTSQMQYNGLGQEITRLLSGDILSEWQYNEAGKPTNHDVYADLTNVGTLNTSTQSGVDSGIQNGILTPTDIKNIRKVSHVRTRKYSWGISNQLKSMTNNLTGGGKITYGYDEFSNLVSAKHDGFRERIADIFRTTDDAGNIYETQGKTDRIYAEGSRMTQANRHKQEYLDFNRKKVHDKASYAYDEEGNVVLKATADNRVWQYEYYGNGMLARVKHIVADYEMVEVGFRYDSLGRRVEKSTTVISAVSENTPSTATPAKITTFVWDGNNPIHEIQNEDVTTWVFNDGFVPVAKITKDDSYSILTDYLGTPVEAYDSEGDKVWSAELDIYGRVMTDRNHAPKGDIDFIPFRYQGQYHDIETGLYYNRFRYYDPTTGNYTQQDPIGLAGGNPTLYAYVNNPHWAIDPFGLDEFVYQLVNKDGAVVYYGITGRDASVRLSEHHREKDPNLKMQILTVGLTHDEARSIEGNLIRNRLLERITDYSVTDSIETQLSKSGLYNKNRGREKERWTSQNPLNEHRDKMLDKPIDVQSKCKP